MWAFFSARLRMWLILAVAAPVLGWLSGKLGDAIAARRGPNNLTRGLCWARDFLRRRSRGPLAARLGVDPADARTPAR